MTTIAGIYQNGDDTPSTSEWDTSTDYIDAYIFGTDYITFRAGEYFEDGDEHELQIRIGGNAIFQTPSSSEYARIVPKGWVIGYASNEDTLQVHPEELLFVEPIAFSPSTTVGDTVIARTVIVTDFGRAVKAVVVAIGAASAYPEHATYPNNGFVYEYQYGVFTPGTSTRTWGGDVYVLGDVTVPEHGTLEIGADTYVRVSSEDLAVAGVDTNRVEMNVEGTLVASGAAGNPVVFESWTPTTTEDWVGFYFDAQSGGGTFNHCEISRAEYGIESYVPLTVTNTVIRDCRYAGIVAQAGGGLVQECALVMPGAFGIFLVTDSTVVRSTAIDSATATGILVQPNARLRARNATVMNCDTGLYVNGSMVADVDSACYFYANDIGVQFYSAGSASTLRGSGITWNTSAAVLCDSASHPLIAGNTLARNGSGIYCSNNSSPRIEGNAIQSSGSAITATLESSPDVGHQSPSGGQSPGNNRIAHTTRYVANYTAATIYAQNNCWNKNAAPCSPPSNMFTGSVNRDYPICCEFLRFTGGEGEPHSEQLVFEWKLPDPEPAREVATELGAIIPNPFNPSATINYSLATRSQVEISVYDVAGRLVEALVNGAQAAGQHAAVWNGMDRRGSPAASGVYFVRMAADGHIFTRKMVLLK